MSLWADETKHLKEISLKLRNHNRECPVDESILTFIEIYSDNTNLMQSNNKIFILATICQIKYK